MNLRDMPILLPEIPDDQYHLPELVGRLFDVTVLSRDVLRPLADAWCAMALSCLTRVGQTIRPMRAAAEKRRAAALIVNDAQLQVVDGSPLGRARGADCLGSASLEFAYVCVM